MWFLLKPVELKYKTQRAKSAVIHSLNEVASFKGDNFRFPFRVIGNPLMVKSKLVAGHGVITCDGNLTIVTVTLRPAGQLKVARVIFTVIGILPIAGALGLILDGKVLPFFGLLFVGMLFLSFPRIMYFFALQDRKNTIEYLVSSKN